MPAPVETINPAETFPSHYPLYVELCKRAAIAHNSLSPVPQGLAHIDKLSRPSKVWGDHRTEVARYKMFDTALPIEDAIRYYDLELHVFMHTRRLIGATAIEATIPLEINDDPHRLFTDAKAKVAIDAHDDRQRRRRTHDKDSLAINISGLCTNRDPDEEDRFSVTSTLLTDLDHIDGRHAPAPTVLGARLITLFQFYDALDYIEAHRTA